MNTRTLIDQTCGQAFKISRVTTLKNYDLIIGNDEVEGSILSSGTTNYLLKFFHIIVLSWHLQQMNSL